MSWPWSGPAFSVIWLWKMPDSELGSLWESSSFVLWLVLNALRDVSGAVPAWPRISGFMKRSSGLANAPSMRFSVLLNSWDNFFCFFPQFPQKLGLCSLLAIWQHWRFAPGCSKEVPHKVPCLLLQVFFCFSKLPFSTGKVMMSRFYLIIFSLKANQFE